MDIITLYLVEDTFGDAIALCKYRDCAEYIIKINSFLKYRIREISAMKGAITITFNEENAAKYSSY